MNPGDLIKFKNKEHAPWEYGIFLNETKKKNLLGNWYFSYEVLEDGGIHKIDSIFYTIKVIK